MVERASVTQAVLAQYRNRPFSFERRTTCLHLLRAQMVAFGYSPPPIPNVRTALGAKKALKKAGHASLMQLIDTLLPRIAPARMLVGDVALLPGESGDGKRSELDTVVIHVGGGKVLGWHGVGGGMTAIPVQPLFLAAWRLS